MILPPSSFMLLARPCRIRSDSTIMQASKHTLDSGFPPVARIDARILILGSMPSRKSLDEAQYYAHPQNAFWPIMGELFGFSPALPYAERLEQLRDNGFALWDVAHQCVRPGSLDQAIDMATVVANDFPAFFATHKNVRQIFFNGRKAEELFRKLVLPALPEGLARIERHLLPSTSPAHAGLSRAAKLAAWQSVKTNLEGKSPS